MIAHADEVKVLQAIRAGARDYLVKGTITPESLQLAVSKTIATAQLQYQMQQQLERERLIRHITQQIHQSLELDEILRSVLRCLKSENSSRLIAFWCSG